MDLSSVPETFVCLFLVGDFILQHLFLFVNSFLKIYLYLFIFFILLNISAVSVPVRLRTHRFLIMPIHRRQFYGLIQQLPADGPSPLQPPDMCAAANAAAFGFIHLSYFSKNFCRTYGCTPREYRGRRQQPFIQKINLSIRAALAGLYP